MYSFWFTADTGPSEGTGNFKLFESGDRVTIDLLAPEGPDNPFDMNSDGCVDGGDLGIFLSYWGTPNAAADFNGDGMVDGGDAGLLLANWGGENCG